jgi:hypothetical protein
MRATLIKACMTPCRPFWVDVAETDAGPARGNVTGLIWPLISVIVEEEGQRAAQARSANVIWYGWVGQQCRNTLRVSRGPESARESTPHR